MKKLNQQGFSIWELLLLLLLILILILLGWWVWQQQEDNAPADNSSSQASSSPEEVPAAPVPDPTADWIPFSSVPGQYNLKYPPTWIKASNLENCNSGLLLLGGNAAATGKCATEYFGQIAVGSNEGDISAEVQLTAAYYTGLTNEAITLNGVVGRKQTGTYQETSDEFVGTMKTGDQVVKYIFVTNGRTYTATYIKTPTFPDVLSDFNLMVTETLKFQP